MSALAPYGRAAAAPPHRPESELDELLDRLVAELRATQARMASAWAAALQQRPGG